VYFKLQKSLKGTLTLHKQEYCYINNISVLN